MLHGLIILYIYIAYFVITIILVFSLHALGIKYQLRWLNWWTILIIMILIPFWDVVPAHYYFDKLCEKDAGLKVFKTVKNVDGFLKKSSGKSESENLIRKFRYSYIEGTKLPKGLVRYSLDNEGNLIIEDIVKPISRYVVVENIGEGEKLDWNIKRFDEWIEDTVTGEKLALNRKYGYFGNWVTRIFKSFGATGAVYCPVPGQYLSEYYQSILMPPLNIKE